MPEVIPLQGLTSTEARQRLIKYGPNMVAEDRPHPWLLFLKKFWAPVPWMLEATIALQFAIGKAERSGDHCLAADIQCRAGFCPGASCQQGAGTTAKVVWRSRCACCATKSGSRWPRKSWCREMWCICAWAILRLPIYACSTGRRCSISPRSPANHCRLRRGWVQRCTPAPS